AEQASQSPVAAASGRAASGSTAPTSADAPPARLSELGPAFVDGSSRTRGLRRRIRQPGDVDDSNEPVDLEVKRDEGITIRFADGLVARIGLMELRQGCPCATCRSLRDRGEEGWPGPGAPDPLRITDAELHGAYALQI